MASKFIVLLDRPFGYLSFESNNLLGSKGNREDAKKAALVKIGPSHGTIKEICRISDFSHTG